MRAPFPNVGFLVFFLITELTWIVGPNQGHLEEYETANTCMDRV